MKNQTDYSLYECPFSYIEKDCGHELTGPEGCADHNGEPACYVWCACGFRGPVFCLDPYELKLTKKDNNAIHSDSESRAVLEGVEYLVNQVDAETISLTRRQ